MKKIALLLIIVLASLSLVFTSCDDDSKTTDPATCPHTTTANTKVIKEATCTEEGVLEGTCSDCGATVTKPFNAAGHNMVGGRCTVCGETE